jgi:hypothetical protein
MKIVKLAACCLGFFFFHSCKKEKLPSEIVTVACIERCNYITDFTGHHWRQVGEYDDSSAYALNNIGLIPLPSSYVYQLDSCDLDNEWVNVANGTSFVLNRLKCDPAEPDTFYQPKWQISDDRKMLSLNSGASFYIHSLNSNEMKLYYYYTATLPGHPPLKFIRLRKFKST